MASEKINREEIIQPENVVYQKPELLNDVPMHYCPGCSHGVVHKLVAEVIADMGMEEKAVGVSPVGCAPVSVRQRPSMHSTVARTLLSSSSTTLSMA